MNFAAVVWVSLRSGSPCLGAPDNDIATETGSGSTYRGRNAVQTHPAARLRTNSKRITPHQTGGNKFIPTSYFENSEMCIV